MSKRLAVVNAVVFFLFWVLVLLAGADRPPPPAFLWLVLLVAACAGVAYWRVPTYVAWSRTRKPGRFWRVALDGLLAGVLVGLLPLAVRGNGEPGIAMGVRDYAIWFVVLAMAGVVNAVALYTVNVLVAQAVANRRRA